MASGVIRPANGVQACIGHHQPARARACIHQPSAAEKVETPMTQKQEAGLARSLRWNKKNLILSTLEAMVLVIGLWMHPVLESSSVRALA